MNNIFIRFLIIATLAHVFSYLISGGISYQFIVKELWENKNTILSNYLRTPSYPELWNFAMIWQIPAQFLRGLLMGLVLLPLVDFLKTLSFKKLFLFYSSLIFVFTHFAASAPSPANIEGAVYLKPEFIKLGFLLMQPEMIIYSLIYSFILSKYGLKNE